jgi:hypothetical protein
MGHDDTDPVGDCAFFYGYQNENYELWTGYFVHKRINSTIKRVEFLVVVHHMTQQRIKVIKASLLGCLLTEIHAVRLIIF